MQSGRVFFVGAAVVVVVFSATSPATAGFSGLQQTLFRGLEYAGNYSYLLSPQNGPLYNYNQYTQAIQYNRAAGGYTFESYRFFGPDSYGNTNTLDLGAVKVQLGPDNTLLSNPQPVGIHTNVGYSTRIIPEVFFSSETGQRSFNQFSGISTFSPTPLKYTVSVNTGLQNYEWSGNAIVETKGSMNALGSYDFNMRITNVGDYTADGVLVKDEQVTDFDLGPIDVSGNILTDLIAGVWQATGAQDSAIVPRILSGASQKDKKLDSLLTRLRAGELLSDEEMQYITQCMIEAAFRADPLGFLQNGLPAEVPGFEGISLTSSATDSGTTAIAVPEPCTLALVAGSAVVITALRRWRRW